ncbi:MAG TPA: hypothetical protein VL588_10440 [Bdellovibrionota bacterium]|nr:hypothetical protein [Bdellovibrionota bacterium]
MSTNRETVKTLCKSIVSRLENQKYIKVIPEKRSQVIDELLRKVGPFVLTDQDLRERALEAIGEKADILDETAFSDNERFRAAKQVIRKSFGDDVLHGLYFQKSLKNLAAAVREAFMDLPSIDDVFGTDDELDRATVEVIQRFDPKNVH